MAFGELETLDLKTIYKFLVSDAIRVKEDVDPALMGAEKRLIALDCELDLPTNDWPEAWRRARLKGLGPELTSFILKMMWGILLTRERLHRMLSKLYLTNACPLCSQDNREPKEDLKHALMDCAANKEAPADLMTLLRSFQPTITKTQVLALDLEVDPAMELPLVWITATMLFSIWSQRQEGSVSDAKTRAELRARCKLLEQSNVDNAFMLTSQALEIL